MFSDDNFFNLEKNYENVTLNLRLTITDQQLTAILGQVIEDLCKNGPFQTDYLRHAPCMKRVQNEYSSCSAR